MNTYLAVAGGLALALGFGHSVIGEVLLIRRLTREHLPPVAGSQDLARRILRANWHSPTVALWGFGAILLGLLAPSLSDTKVTVVEIAVSLSFFAVSLIWMIASRGKHPGWVVLLLIAILVWLA